MASLAWGSQTIFPGLHRPLKFGIHLAGKKTQFMTSVMVIIILPLWLHYHVLTKVKKSQNRCAFSILSSAWASRNPWIYSAFHTDSGTRNMGHRYRNFQNDTMAKKLPNSLQNKVFVPCTLQTGIIKWAHNTPALGHPRIDSAKQLIQIKLWWPCLPKAVERFIKSCTICAMTKNPHQQPADELMPLPIPNRSWSSQSSWKPYQGHQYIPQGLL